MAKAEKTLDMNFLKGLDEEIEVDIDVLRKLITSNSTGKVRIPVKIYFKNPSVTVINNSISQKGE